MSAPVPPTLREHARSLARLTGLGALTMGWVGVAAAHQAIVPEARREAIFQHYLPHWGRSLVASFGGQVILTPESRVVPARGARLVVANHRSPFDIGVLLSLFGGHALSRADLAGWPFIGLAARRAGTIFVERESAGSGASAIRAIRDRLRLGSSVLVFPEGQTSAGDQVLPFKPGAFAAARGLDVEIVPVGLAYEPGIEWVDETFVEHVLRVARRPATHLVVAIGAPQPAQGRAAVLATTFEHQVQAHVRAARRHLDSLR